MFVGADVLTSSAATHPPRRLRFITVLLLLPLMMLGSAFTRLALAPSEPRTTVTPVRGALRSADGTVLASGPLHDRRYPQGAVAGPVVGFVGTSAGLEGAERAFDAALQRGEDVTLTLDARVQDAVEEVLIQAVRRTSAQYANAIVMDTRTGDLRAVATVPGFAPASWRTAPAGRWRNRALLDEYEPGSVIKALTVAALLDAGLTTPETRYDTPMVRRVARAAIHDIVPHPARLSTREILRYSSNVGMTRLVEGVPAPQLRRAFAAFGLGRPVTLALPAGDGRVRDATAWTELSQATMAFGQGLTVTTLQLAAAFNVLAADGRYVTPRLTAAVPVRTRPVLAPATAARMREVLHGVIDDGIRGKAALPGYHVGGKTGTAQVVVSGRYSESVFSSTFAGFLPADRPQFTVAVMVRGAQREYQGSQVAAPIFRDISAALVSLYALAPAPEDRKAH
ncbi:cell division protein FtsI (penicillin-binding protein 3) [Deinococcus metalli]|uniref:Cell division protein FtsI (Penicillin-binding protein 3) n=1 Tax=Deinococcus metalli TaxID=1141878 RepID=A0A7W8KIP9_9DEIO|nr:penicillin-binding protein 2 [Deinococcus metalli]MBB5378478.1 cell division protein FtsI (penicillin-binding protein 3) [Deinococcus metalli]GHF58013.1 penicillin-binding protein 2 [Deinococcus metalli]